MSRRTCTSRRPLVTATAVALVLILSAGLALAANNIRAMVRPVWNDDKVLTILVIGSDSGLPRSGDPRTGRSDAIHIIAVDTKKLRATIVDIPRDSYISGDKVNAHMSYGGPERLKSVLSSYTNIRIDHYVLTNFRGMRGLVDGMGGLKVDLPQAVFDSASRARLKAGKNRLVGKEALALSRARKSVPGGDFGRTRNQGLLLRAAHRQLRSKRGDLGALTSLIGVLGRNTTTDIPRADLFRFANLALNIKSSSIKQVSLSGGVGMVGGASIVHLNPGSAFSDIRRGRIGR